VDSLVETPGGNGVVIDVSLLKGTCKVRLDKTPDAPKVFSCRECKLIRQPHPKETAVDPVLAVPEEE